MVLAGDGADVDADADADTGGAGGDADGDGTPPPPPPPPSPPPPRFFFPRLLDGIGFETPRGGVFDELVASATGRPAAAGDATD